MKTRLALDIGDTSIGWALYELSDCAKPSSLTKLLAAGVRLFSDGRNEKDKTPLAVKRREARGMRRGRDRYLQRRKYLLHLLSAHGLFPNDSESQKALETIDPYTIRAQAVSEKVPIYHLGRALFHLNQRRGFKSNRISDATDDKETGKIALASKRLKESLAEGGFATLGQFYADRQSAQNPRDRQPVRIRMTGEGSKSLYDFYPTRDLIEAEFDALWMAQQSHYPKTLTQEAYDKIKSALLFQRKLKKPLKGKCPFNTHEERLYQAHPLTQAFRIYQELNNIRIEFELGAPEQRLDLETRDMLAEQLLAGVDISMSKLRKALNLPAEAKINLAEGQKDKLKGCETAKKLAKDTPKRKSPWGASWFALSAEKQEEIVEQLLYVDDKEDLKGWLRKHTDLGAESIDEVISINLIPGTSRLGLTAMRAIVNELNADVVPYSTAAERAGYHHSQFSTEQHDELPYYGEILTSSVIPDPAASEGDHIERVKGKIANPTVHIGLNQIRTVVNELIKQYGKPDQIVIELARDLKQSKKERDKAQKENKKNEEQNARLNKELTELGERQNGENRLRLRLWEELGDSPLNRCCPYTGETISKEQLFSAEVEIEHILPFSRTLDDSRANKTVSLRRANRLKRNYSPAEAAEHIPNMFNLDEMLARAQFMPANKSWRFKPDAMDRFKDDPKNDFLARQLNDTRHLSRAAKTYLTSICDANQVWVVTGRMTSLLRHCWGLNSILSDHNRKNRDDHRHHAIDACTIAAIDRGMLQKISRAAAHNERTTLDKVTSGMDVPYDGFRENVQDIVTKIIVSHKPDHGLAGPLHEETAYGPVRDNDRNRARGDLDIGNVVVRKPVAGLSPKEINQIRDIPTREALQQIAYEAGSDKKELAKLLAEWSAKTGVRRVRMLKPVGDAVPIHDRKTGEPYKYVKPGDNHHMDIIELENGKWIGCAASVFEVNQKGWQPKWLTEHPTAKHIMRLHKGDAVQLDDDGVNIIKVVKRLSPSNNILYLVHHNEGGAHQKRHDDVDDPFRWDLASISKLKDRRARRVIVSPTGKIAAAPKLRSYGVKP